MKYIYIYKLYIIYSVDGSSTQIDALFKSNGKPGDFVFEQEVEDKWLFGVNRRKADVRLSLIYTDYDNIAVYYECYETKVNFVSRIDQRGYIDVRKRTFDSLSQYLGAVARLKQLGIDPDHMRFIYNGPNCKN